MRKNKTKAKCHPDKSHAARGFCASCYAKWLKSNNPEFAESQRKSRKEWLAKNPDYERNYKNEEIKKKGGSAYQRKLDLKKNYGLTVEQYDKMVVDQGGLCAICGKTPSGKRKLLCVDHCHRSGQIRGLLCLSCNCGLGYFKDSVDLLKKAVVYLEKSEREEG